MPAKSRLAEALCEAAELASTRCEYHGQTHDSRFERKGLPHRSLRVLLGIERDYIDSVAAGFKRGGDIAQREVFFQFRPNKSNMHGLTSVEGYIQFFHYVRAIGLSRPVEPLDNTR